MYLPLNLPPVQLRIENSQVFDVVRKKLVHLTPEEWVRQHILHYLISNKNYPAGLIEVEKQIQLFNTTKRVDILVRTPDLKPVLLVECKAPEITITQKEAEQLARYQITLQAPLSFLSSGRQHIVMQHKDGSISYLSELPAYSASGY